jgi:hypothetical protein
VLLVLTLVTLRYVDEANLSSAWRSLARNATPVAAILMPLGFFLSTANPDTASAGPAILCVYAGALLLAAGLVTLGTGLLRRGNR